MDSDKVSFLAIDSNPAADTLEEETKLLAKGDRKGL